MTKSQVTAPTATKPRVLTESAPNFLAAIIDSADDAIVSKDLNGIVTSWNPSAQRIFGYRPEEMIGQSILRLIPQDLHYEEDYILGKIRAGERIEHFETTRVRKNGERFPISVTISPIKDENGKVIGASKIARDISERQRGDQSRARLAAIVDSADDAIISKDLNSIVTSWNPGAQRLFGYNAEEMIGQSILRIIPPELHHEEEEILRKLRAGEKIEHYETTRVAKDGTLHEVSVTISPIRDRTGKVIGGSKIARNIADRKHVERLAMQAEKIAITGRMAAAVAHEINNPLASVLNLIYLARQDHTSKKDAQELLATAEAEIGRVAHIARQTLGYYRDTGSPSEVFLHDLMENVLSVYKGRLLRHQVVVEAKFDDIRKILVRSGEIVQIFSNIVANSIDAMPQGGKLCISICSARRPENDGFQVVISDTGQGIRRDDLEKVFDPFFTTKANVGTGLGLWIAKQLVERHSGRISISSSTDPGGSGTVVEIYFPFGGVKAQAANLNELKVETEAP